MAGAAHGQASLFSVNELRTATAKDRLRAVRRELKDGSEGGKRHSAAVTAAFKGEADWAPATESYYSRKNDLVKRALALETEVDAAVKGNSPEKAPEVSEKLDEVLKRCDALRTDYEFYMALPRLAKGKEGPSARATMRLLSQTGDYHIALAYYLDKDPKRKPFDPLQPGVMPAPKDR